MIVILSVPAIKRPAFTGALADSVGGVSGWSEMPAVADDWWLEGESGLESRLESWLE